MIKWKTGLNGFRNNILDGMSYTTILEENDFEPNRNIDDIFVDHLKECHGVAEVLYSGGVDSETILASLLRSKVPVEVMTMVIKIRGAIMNVADMYYAEKFCREHGLKQNLFVLDADNFFKGGQYLEYLLPYNIVQPTVASHFWLIEQCSNYPIIGGDWPWIQTHKNPMVLSPYRLEYSSYERFMQAKGITGIGNMISHSFESCYYFMDRHLKYHNTKLYNQEGIYNLFMIPFLKELVYDLPEPRLKSHGWEKIPLQLFNISEYRTVLNKSLGLVNNKIIWGEKIKELLQTTISENDNFL